MTRPTSRLAAALALAALLAGCGPSPEERAAEAAAAEALRLAQREDAAVLAERQYEVAKAERDIALAAAHAEVIIAEFAGTATAARVAADAAPLIERARAEREAARLAALWTYHALPNPDAGGIVYSGYAYALREPSRPHAKLVLRRAPDWGQSVYLVLDEPHQFDCPPGCRVRIAFDDAPPAAWAARKPEENLQALFIEDDARFVRAIAGGAQRVSVEVSQGGEPRTLVWEVGGFVMERLERAAPDAGR